MIRQSTIKKFLIQLDASQLVELLLRATKISPEVKMYLAQSSPDIDRDEILGLYIERLQKVFFRGGKIRRTVKRKNANALLNEYWLISSEDTRRFLKLKWEYLSLFIDFLNNDWRIQNYGDTVVRLRQELQELSKEVDQQEMYQEKLEEKVGKNVMLLFG